MIVCWGAKGGAGTSVIAAAISLVQARQPAGALLVDLRGDQSALLGLREPPGPGVADWIVRGSQAPPDALARIEVPVVDGLRLLPRGSWDNPTTTEVTSPLGVLGALLGAERRSVIVDAGCLAAPGDGPPTPATVASSALVANASTSLLVARPCYLTLRRAVATGVRPHGVVVVGDSWRALRAADVAQVVGAPVVADVALDPSVARVVDAGLLTSRLPRLLERAVADLAVVTGAPR